MTECHWWSLGRRPQSPIGRRHHLLSHRSCRGRLGVGPRSPCSGPTLSIIAPISLAALSAVAPNAQDNRLTVVTSDVDKLDPRTFLFSPDNAKSWDNISETGAPSSLFMQANQLFMVQFDSQWVPRSPTSNESRERAGTVRICGVGTV